MTPEEHYDEAERLTLSLRRQVSIEHGWPTIDADRSQATDAAVNRAVALAGLHAKLAEVGLLVRYFKTQFADEIDERNHTWATLHDFPSGTSGDLGTGHNCRKCGRCEKHKGAECLGGQKHSVTKTCMVCVHIGSGTKVDD